MECVCGGENERVPNSFPSLSFIKWHTSSARHESTHNETLRGGGGGGGGGLCFTRDSQNETGVLLQQVL